MAQASQKHPTHYILILLLSFLTLLFPQPTAATKTGFSFNLIHRDSIHSPLYSGNLTTAERLRRLVTFSKSHALSLESSVIQPQDVNIRPFVAHDSWLYMVKVGIGSPPTNVSLLLDTGSSLVWTQCQPCNRCFHQDGRKYKPAASSTYLPLPCNHPLCARPYRCVQGECRYDISYADDSYTRGALATDHFTFASRTTGRIEPIQGMVFGCSRESSERMFATTKIGGILGMAGGPQSLAVQLADRTQRRFSYCLVPLQNPANSYLRFGTDILVRRNAQSTPLLRTNTPYYHLNLNDISVNGQRLNLPPGTFSLRPNGTGGCMIDSGAGVTIMITPAYNSVKRALMDYFTRFKLTMLGGRHEYGLDLCYRMRRNFRAFPSMDFHFQGAHLHLEKNNLFYIIPGITSKFCLAMIPRDGFTLLGAVQQQNIRFIYDVGREFLTFAPENCAQN